MTEELQMVAVQTHNCGVLHVYIQGTMDRNGKTVVLTCHDVGTNYKTFVRFVNHPSMADVKNKSIFLHVCVPGQEDNAADYIGDFPSLDNIAEDLTCVLDKFEVKSCILFGEGAGANILCRFAMENSNRILGIILVHCTSTTAGIFEYCKDKVINMRLENDIMTDGAWEYLVTHKFGTAVDVNKKDRQSYVDQFETHSQST
ncbi:hypothetical protein KIN20_016504 [Parelaphostrongylus tenuis]|uniref:Uncharacterized protein n=1 Tax=Parelaphostrongylus tenuis TaxID=148309 RepID=A0AAD5N1G8_PARTN|nr:hypothetical protein KIN20_016504 [Parelaphostrongylus tenuis]